MTNVKLYKSKKFVTTWHIIAVSQYLYSMHYDLQNIELPESLYPTHIREKDPAGRFKFLTYWCLVSITQNYNILLLHNKFHGKKIIYSKLL